MSDSLDVDQTLNHAIRHHEAGELEPASALYRNVLEADPDNGDALNLYGLILQDQGRVDEGIMLIERALEREPEFSEALANLARGLNLKGHAVEAAAAARHAIELEPDQTEAWHQLGLACLSLQQYGEAMTALRKASESFPDRVEIRAGIGTAAHNVNDHEAAAEAWRAVLRMQPDRIDALVYLGAALTYLGKPAEALRLHRRAAQLAPDHPFVLNALAVTLHRQYEAHDLLKVSQHRLQLDPGDTDALFHLGSAQVWVGQLEAAKQTYRELLRILPDNMIALTELVSLEGHAAAPADVARLRDCLADATVNIAERIAAGFAAGSAHDQAGDYDTAFAMFGMANSLAHAGIKARKTNFDREGMAEYIAWVRTVFPPSVFNEQQSCGDDSDLPVFIVGMPRSGTSLVEQICVSHSGVFGAGERKDIFELLSQITGRKTPMAPFVWDQAIMRRETGRYVRMLRTRAPDAARIIDKLPDNIMFLGQIATLLPNARFIICRRDLRDVCLSCYTTNFDDEMTWTYDQRDCAHRAVAVEQLTNHWLAVLRPRILEVEYEKLVSDVEGESRRLIEFLGLDWEPACLEYHRTNRPVVTASARQIRRPVYRSSIGRWHHYEKYIGPMLAILDEGRAAAGEMAADEIAAASPEAEARFRGVALLVAGDFELGIRILRDAADRFPHARELHIDLAKALTQTGEFAGAAAVWRHVLATRPGDAMTLCHLGYCLSEIGQHEEALAAHRRSIELDPDKADLYFHLGGSLFRAKEVKSARDAYARTVALAPENPLAAMNLGHCEAALGNFDVAEQAYRDVLRLKPDHAETRASLISLGKSNGPDDLATIRRLFADSRLPMEDRVWAAHGLGHTEDKAGNYDAAFVAYRTANVLQREISVRRGKSFEPADYAAHCDAIMSLFPASVFQETATWGDPSELPVFIVGMPRSGTSLVEQILASHHAVFGAGERVDIINIANALERGGTYVPPGRWNRVTVLQQAIGEVERLRALGGDAMRVSDKLPDNLQLLGHIGVLLPKARVIACRRDPRDTGLSCYFTHFAAGLPWSYDLGDIAAVTRQCERMIAHWRNVLPNPFMEVQYEKLVADLEGESRRLIEFLGLAWDDNCLRFRQTSRMVNTASNWQVRQSLYSSSVGRWRNYEKHLGPLINALGDLVSVVPGS
jgi:tetratricopeptide (TPR) repeat protein